MINFAMFCKTYSGDFNRVSNLVKSFNKHNNDNIYLFISVPEEELNLFFNLSSKNIKVISDESYAKDHLSMEKYNFSTLGYLNAQICKLTFYRAQFAKNYLILDSDTVFIRDFYFSDFMHDENTPYIVLTMDKDLSIERHYPFWSGRLSNIKKIHDCIELKDRRLRQCHNSQVLNSRVLDSLYLDFMQKKNLNYVDMLKIFGHEVCWYNAWFQKAKIIEEFVVEPFFKMLHYREEYIFSKLKLLRKKDYAKAYIGLVLNSKWEPKTPINYDDPSLVYKILYIAIVNIEKIYHKIIRKDILVVIYNRLLSYFTKKY